MKVGSIKYYLIFQIVVLSIIGCTESNKKSFRTSEIYKDCAKFLIGYYKNDPVFHVYGKNELILLENESVYSFMKFETSLKPKFVLDSIVIFADNNSIIVNYLESKNLRFEINSPVINIAYSNFDSCLYFSDNYDKEIKKLNLISGKIELLPIKGYFLTIRNNDVFYYKYTNESDVSAIVDLYKININQNSIPIKIGSLLREEFIIISPNSEYVLSDGYCEEGYCITVFCLNSKSQFKVDKAIPDDFPFAYYSIVDKKFVYYNIYTLEKMYIPINCN